MFITADEYFFNINQSLFGCTYVCSCMASFVVLEVHDQCDQAQFRKDDDSGDDFVRD